MLLGSPSVLRESHLDDIKGTTQTHGRCGKYRIGGRRPFQNYQGRKGAPTVLKGRASKVFEEEPECFCIMLGIDGQVIEHSLNVNPKKKPAKQKRQVFTLEQNKAIMEEVEKLLAARFI